MKQKIIFDSSNFYLGSKAKFMACKRPKRKPDFISYDRYGNISSEYWYNSDKNGNFVIRSSSHWSNTNRYIKYGPKICGKISTCYWWLVSNSKLYKYNFTGKAHFSKFFENKSD